MPEDTQFRETILEIGRRMFAKNYVAANDGNISTRLDDGLFLTTPTGVSKGFMNADDLPIVDTDRKLISGIKPSTELLLHLHIYKKRPNVNAVVHAHPPYATGFATAGIPLDRCVLAEIITTIGTIPLAKYGTPSTRELPQSIDPFIETCDAFLLANHGVVTIGKDLMEAYFKMERVEHYAHILFIARVLGGEQTLPKDQVEKLYDLKEVYGIQSPTPACKIGPESKQQADEHNASTPENLDEIVNKILQAVR